MKNLMLILAIGVMIASLMVEGAEAKGVKSARIPVRCTIAPRIELGEEVVSNSLNSVRESKTVGENRPDFNRNYLMQGSMRFGNEQIFTIYAR